MEFTETGSASTGFLCSLLVTSDGLAKPPKINSCTCSNPNWLKNLVTSFDFCWAENMNRQALKLGELRKAWLSVEDIHSSMPVSNASNLSNIITSLGELFPLGKCSVKVSNCSTSFETTFSFASFSGEDSAPPGLNGIRDLPTPMANFARAIGSAPLIVLSVLANWEHHS